METITLPRTDLTVSRVCLGTMQFAGSKEAGTCDKTWCVSSLWGRAAVDVVAS